MELKLSHHRPRPRDPHAPVPERDFIDGYEALHGLKDDDPKRLRALMLERLSEAFPFHPALPERILLRLSALAKVWRHPVMESWKASAGETALGHIVLRVAAVHSLAESGWFEPGSFFEEILRRMNNKGRA